MQHRKYTPYAVSFVRYYFFGLPLWREYNMYILVPVKCEAICRTCQKSFF